MGPLLRQLEVWSQINPLQIKETLLLMKLEALTVSNPRFFSVKYDPQTGTHTSNHDDVSRVFTREDPVVGYCLV